MAEPKLLAVTGATGAQGGGLAHAILNDPSRSFRVRALTRHPSGDKGKTLAALGAEVVAADLDDQKSLERAFAGAYGAFCVTNYWEHLSPEREIAQAGHLAAAAKAAGLRHVIWSTFEDTRLRVPLSDTRMPTLMGKYKVPHFDGKAEANRYFTESGVPTTLLLTSWYWDNLIYFGAGPKPGPDGTLVFGLPMGDRKLPGIAARDIGGCAYGIFRAGGEYQGKTVGLAGEHLTGAEIATQLSRALKREVRYANIPFDVYRGLGFPGADDLANMFQYKYEFNAEYCGARDPAVARKLNPAMQTFAEWLKENASRIPLE
jgi:uncharacterized protein YbjT (DUF2867 family)